jgi:hypothetical protein
MKTYDVRHEGLLTGFEISSWIGRWRACRVVRDIPGARIVRWPRRWAKDEDEFCEFELAGERFLIIEPFGNSRRFWIVSDPPAPAIAIDNVKGFFERARAIDWRWGKGG